MRWAGTTKVDTPENRSRLWVAPRTSRSSMPPLRTNSRTTVRFAANAAVTAGGGGGASSASAPGDGGTAMTAGRSETDAAATIGSAPVAASSSSPPPLIERTKKPAASSRTPITAAWATGLLFNLSLIRSLISSTAGAETLSGGSAVDVGRGAGGAGALDVAGAFEQAGEIDFRLRDAGIRLDRRVAVHFYGLPGEHADPGRVSAQLHVAVGGIEHQLVRAA